MPRPLPDELLEEVLRRLPPHEPAELVRAALVSRRWCRLVSDPGFRRRFREFHRIPPMLGILCNLDNDEVYKIDKTRFIPTAAFCFPRTDFPGMRVLDARHGRVLCEKGHRVLAIWDPITDEMRDLPSRPHYASPMGWTAAVVCAASVAGACDHLDCHRRPFVVVLLGSVFKGPDAGHVLIWSYASETAAWTEPVHNTEQPGCLFFSNGSALVGNALYFMEFWGSRILKYNLELQKISWILAPSSLPRGRGWHRYPSVLIATENGELGLATKQGSSKLCIWLRKQDDDGKVGDEWQNPSRAIKLKTLLPAHAVLSKVDLVGSAEGLGIIFMRADDVVYTIDLKTCKVKKVYEGKINNIFPYMSFYTPALETACAEEPGVGGSSA